MGSAADFAGVSVYTVGHSTRSIDELASILATFTIAMVVDVRTVPRSRHNPQFGAEILPATLSERGFRYAHLAALGGLRKPHVGSPNTGWRNTSFRGFADYMATERFEKGLEELRALVAEARVALMCAEAVPWRCHRSLIADALTVRGAGVCHILGPSKSSQHSLTPFAEVRGLTIVYPSTSQPWLPGVESPTDKRATIAHARKHP